MQEFTSEQNCLAAYKHIADTYNYSDAFPGQALWVRCMPK
jgi:hypothetical protein